MEARVRSVELDIRRESQDAWKTAFELGFEKCQAQLTFAKSLLGVGVGGAL